MSILIACFCVVTPGAEKSLTSADLCCFAYTSHFCFNPLLLNQTFQAFQFHFMAFFQTLSSLVLSLELRMTKTFQRSWSQSLLKTAASDVLGRSNSWTSKKFTCCTHCEMDRIREESRLDKSHSEDRNVCFFLFVFFYECVVHDHVSVSGVSTCAWGKAIRFLKSETQVFLKGLKKKNCHLLTINLSALPLSAFLEITANAFLPLSKSREHVFFSSSFSFLSFE